MDVSAAVNAAVFTSDPTVRIAAVRCPCRPRPDAGLVLPGIAGLDHGPTGARSRGPVSPRSCDPGAWSAPRPHSPVRISSNPPRPPRSTSAELGSGTALATVSTGSHSDPPAQWTQRGRCTRGVRCTQETRWAMARQRAPARRSLPADQAAVAGWPEQVSAGHRQRPRLVRTCRPPQPTCAAARRRLPYGARRARRDVRRGRQRAARACVMRTAPCATGAAVWCKMVQQIIDIAPASAAATKMVIPRIKVI